MYETNVPDVAANTLTLSKLLVSTVQPLPAIRYRPAPENGGSVVEPIYITVPAEPALTIVAFLISPDKSCVPPDKAVHARRALVLIAVGTAVLIIPDTDTVSPETLTALPDTLIPPEISTVGALP